MNSEQAQLAAARTRADDLEARVAERTHELTLALASAQAAAHAKMEFLANMSHEIRTPLTAILGFTELLRTYDGPSQQRAEFLEIIHRNGDHLLSLINNVLDLSKIEAGQVLIENLPLDLPALLSEVASLLRPTAVEKGLQLVLSYDGPCPQRILADATRLRQIVLNLVSNAIKFTERGRVTIRTRLLGDPDGASRIEIAVVDSGIGMTADQAARIFQPFVQADSSTSRRFGGTGLGLSISHRLTLLMGGDLSVTSEPGRGTSFVLVLATGALDGTSMLTHVSEPMLERGPRVSPGPQRRPRLTGRILLAEDGAHNQRLLSTILRQAGAEVSLANNGQEAVEAALRARDAGQPFELILMDMQMPVMDGYAATQRLRGAGWLGPIIALTAHAMDGDRERCLAEGCDAYETKPVRADRLVETCAMFLPGPGVPDE